LQLSDGPINIFIPPSSPDLDDRYQIELRSMTLPGDSRRIVRFTGSAAMGPSRDNRVTLSAGRKDDYGVPRAITVLTPSVSDERRTQSMIQAIHDVAARLGGTWLDPPVVLPCGSSYHEAGTLRIATTEQESAADPRGLLLGSRNVFVGDGSAFASVGVANPILTLTAMGYRLAMALSTYLGSGSKS
jgi:choline dehydrogenase-like flavoprotein